MLQGLFQTAALLFVVALIVIVIVCTGERNEAAFGNNGKARRNTRARYVFGLPRRNIRATRDG